MARVALVTKTQAVQNAEALATARGLDAQHTAWLRLEYLDKQANEWVREQ